MNRENGHSDYEQRICPNCDRMNPAAVPNCSRCGLDFKFLDFVVASFSGNLRVVKPRPGQLNLNQSVYFRSPVVLLKQPSAMRGGRSSMLWRFSGGRLVVEGKGELTIDSKGVSVVTGDVSHNLPFGKILDFESFGGGIQVFNEGRLGGTIYRVNDPWKMWIILFAKINLEPKNALLQSDRVDELTKDEKQFVLNVINKIGRYRKSEKIQRRLFAFFTRGPAAVFWCLVFPPIGFTLYTGILPLV